MVEESLVKTSLRILYKGGKTFSTSSIKNNSTDENLLKFANAIVSLQVNPTRQIHKTVLYKLKKNK